jgi:hypothetical protein
MKNLIVLSSLFLTVVTQAATIKIIGPCSGIPISEGSMVASDLMVNIGVRTIDYLNREKIPFKGDQFGISSIDNSKTGNDAIEVLSDTKMRAYGWCFKINELTPDKMPNELVLTS